MLRAQRGRFVVLEGLEGAGKSTAMSVVDQWFREQGSVTHIKVREPGGTPLAEHLRGLVKQGMGNEEVSDQSELLMMYAARSQLVNNVIAPNLDQGVSVLCDRHDMSTQAYQGGGRGISRSVIRQLGQFVLGDLKPDLVLYLDIDPEAGMRRVSARGEETDRFEASGIAFLEKVRAAYLKAVNESDNAVIIDAAQNQEQVATSIRSALDRAFAA